MRKIKKIKSSIFRLFRLAYLKLFRINDTPQKIALGFGLGVFLGIIPGTGPIAALFLALILGLNRAAALLGSLITNTWLSIATALLSIKIGSYILQVDWRKTYVQWVLFFRNFRFLNLFSLSILKIMLPIFLGYFVISLCLGFIAYLVSLIIISKRYHLRQ